MHALLLVSAHHFKIYYYFLLLCAPNQPMNVQVQVCSQVITHVNANVKKLLIVVAILVCQLLFFFSYPSFLLLSLTISILAKKIKMDESAFYQRLRANFNPDLVFKLVPVVGSSDKLSEWIDVLSSLIATPPTTKIPVLESDYQTDWTTSVSVHPVPLTFTFNNM